MQAPNSMPFAGDGTGRRPGPEARSGCRHCAGQAASGCPRSQIADALTAILLQAEAIQRRHAGGSVSEAEMTRSVRDIVSNARRVWCTLGNVRKESCICTKPPS